MAEGNHFESGSQSADKIKDKNDHPIVCCGNIHDITGQVRVERKSREEGFRTFAETASDALLTIDELGKIVFANSATADVFGYAAEEVIGQNAAILIPEAKHSLDKARFEGYLEDGRSRILGSTFNWNGLHRDGHEVPLEMSLGEFVNNGCRYFTGVVRNVTERHRSEMLIAGQVEISEMIAIGQPLTLVLERIARLIENLEGDLFCSIFLLDADAGFLWPAASPNLPETFKQAVQKITIGLSSGSCGAAVHLKEPVVSQDISLDPIWADYQGFLNSYGFRASWSTPIFNADREVLGTVSILYDHVHNPQPREMEFVKVAAHLASIAIERSRSEELLRNSETRFRALIEKNENGIALADASGAYIYASPATYRILGYAPSEILGKTASHRVHPDDWKLLRETGRALAGKHGSSKTVQYRVRHKNGNWLWVETTLTNLLNDPGVQALVVNFSDITQRKLAEDGLRASEEQYHSLVAALDEGIILMDKNAAILAANYSAERILGLTEQQIRSRNLFDPTWLTIHEDGSPFEADEYPAVITLRTGKPLSNVVMGIRKPDSQLAWISINTQPLMRKGESLPYAAVASFADITEQLRAQAELQRSEEHYRLLFEHSFAGIVRMTASGVLVESNSAMARMLGCDSREELLESDDSNFYFDLAERQRLLDELIASGSLQNREIKMKRLDGSTIWTLVNASVLQVGDSDHEPMLEGVILDITERKLTEQKLEQLYEQSRALSARLETVREEERTHIAREIHDNLGQMMTGLKLDFSWLEKRMARLKDEKLQNEMKPKFGEIAKLLEDAIQTVRNIASDLRPGVLDTLGLRAAIDWQVREFKLKAEVKCSLKLCQEPKDLAQEHATALFRILQETLTNISRHAKATLVKIEMAKTNEEIRLAISDDGIGITEEQIRNPKSLGLLGMRERAMVYGGSVTVTGQPGGGTTVKVRMPIKK